MGAAWQGAAHPQGMRGAEFGVKRKKRPAKAGMEAAWMDEFVNQVDKPKLLTFPQRDINTRAGM